MNKISIIIGSKSDLETLSEGIVLLKEFKTGFTVKILSAHRSPKDLEKYIIDAARGGTQVFIALAGGAAALAGVIASHTILPVIGVPVETKSLKGLDSLLSTVQMPRGVPVATMSIGKAGAVNAVILALEILALQDKRIEKKLTQYKSKMAREIRKTRLKV